MKNGVSLDFPLPESVSRMIDTYLFEFRPTLMRGSSHDHLFPGVAGNQKNARGLGDQISRCLWKSVGLKMTAHQFRHVAGAIYLRARPGEYEVVQRFLGHRNLQTTTNFYVGLETMAATNQFGELIASIAKNET